MRLFKIWRYEVCFYAPRKCSTWGTWVCFYRKVCGRGAPRILGFDCYPVWP